MATKKMTIKEANAVYDMADYACRHSGFAFVVEGFEGKDTATVFVAETVRDEEDGTITFKNVAMVDGEHTDYESGYGILKVFRKMTIKPKGGYESGRFYSCLPSRYYAEDDAITINGRAL